MYPGFYELTKAANTLNYSTSDTMSCLVNEDSGFELYLRAFTGNSATTLHGYNSLARPCGSHSL